MTIPSRSTAPIPVIRGARRLGAHEKTLADLFLHGLKDIYYAEKKIYKSLPKLIKSSRSRDLAAALSDHLEETQTHVTKLEQVFASIDELPRSLKCDAIDGILEEAEQVLEDFGKTKAGDAAIIFSGQAVEHYEITRYGSLHAFATVLGYTEAVGLIESILDQEKAANKKLTELAIDRIDYAAAEGYSIEDEDMNDAMRAH